jgi:hypothetical protein
MVCSSGAKYRKFSTQLADFYRSSGDLCRTHTMLQSPGASLATPFIRCGTDVYTFYREVGGLLQPCYPGGSVVQRIADVVTGRDVAQPTSSSSISQPSSDPDTSGAGYSTSDKIALGIGLGLGLPTLLVTAWGIFRYKSRGHRRP